MFKKSEFQPYYVFGLTGLSVRGLVSRGGVVVPLLGRTDRKGVATLQRLDAQAVIESCYGSHEIQAGGALEAGIGMGTPHAVQV